MRYGVIANDARRVGSPARLAVASEGAPTPWADLASDEAEAGGSPPLAWAKPPTAEEQALPARNRTAITRSSRLQ